MVTLPISFKPFGFTQSVVEIQNSYWKSPSSLWDIAQKITIFALSAFFLPCCIALDLILLPFCLIGRVGCYQNANNYSDLKIQRLKNCIFAAHDDLGQFRNAIREALSYLSVEKKGSIQELFANMGLPDQGEPLLDIFKWSAEAMIIHSLRTLNEQLFPASDPLHREVMDRIKILYRSLMPEESAAVCLKCIDPDFSPTFSPDQLNLLRGIQECAINITQNPVFHRRLFGPLAQEVNEL